MDKKLDLRVEESLSERVVKGGFWVFSLRLIERGFSFVRLIILARLLSPNDFGLLGISLLALSILGVFTQTGFESALIQRKENTEKYLNSAWTVQIIRGLFLFSVLFIISPLVGEFFNTPRASLIIRFLALTQILGAFKNIGIIYFTKELEFNKKFIYSLISNLVDMGVSISFAFLLRNVWALVWGLLAGSFTSLILSYILSSYRPRIEFNLQKVKELFSFGKWILGSNILIFFVTQGDDIFVGKLLGPLALGLYQMAYRFSNMPATEITHVISQVTFPAYSKMQDNLPRLRESYLRVLQFTAFLAFPIAGLIFVLASDFTKLFLGEKWIPMVPAMQVLCIFGAMRSFGTTAGSLFQGVGKPKLLTKLAFFQLIMLAFIIYPLTKNLGIFGTALAVVIPMGVTQMLAGVYLVKIIQISFIRLAGELFFPLISSVGMASVLFYIIKILGIRNVVGLVGVFLIGVVFYGSITYLFSRLFGYKVEKEILHLLRFRR